MKTVMTILILLLAQEALAINASPPVQDKYWHGGGMAVCSYTLREYFSIPGSSGPAARYPKTGAFLFCQVLGLFKEFGIDSHADRADIKANVVGAFLGVNLRFEW